MFSPGIIRLLSFFYFIYTIHLLTFTASQSYAKKPRVLLSINARNEEYSLPTFLGYIDLLQYPKDRISIYIQTDHNSDETATVLATWIANRKHLYHNVIFINEVEPKVYPDETGPAHWSEARYLNCLRLQQQAMQEARSQWADYLFVVSVDNFLLNHNVLNILIDQQKTIVAPMLRLFDPQDPFSNYWAGIDERGYYKSVPEYYDILNHKENGSFEVPMVHSTVLFDLRDNRTDLLQYHPLPEGYVGDIDEVLIYGYTTRAAGLSMHICNVEFFGYMMAQYPLEMTIEQKHIGFIDQFIDYVAYNPPLVRSEYAPYKFPEKTKKGFDEIFMINLVRRNDRREKMEVTLRELGFDYKYFPAVDGKNFTVEKVEAMGVKVITDFKDPYLERPTTFGEIGCFMSHWNIWLEIIERELGMVLVLEDDIRFEPDFLNKMKEVMDEALDFAKRVDWDILYFGRKPLVLDPPERFVKGYKTIVWAKYSYWTLGYVIRLSGAKRLVAGKPLGKMVPVDEYIPIMFDEHSIDELKERFNPRDMIGLSAAPLILFPTHYVGEPGYISDTEDTLSFEGKDVTEFRRIKEKEKAEEKARKEKEEKEKELEEQERDRGSGKTEGPMPFNVPNTAPSITPLHSEL